MTLLQKRALYSLIIGLVLTVGVVIAMLSQGDIANFDSDSGQRYLLYLVMVGVPLTYLILMNVTLRKPTQMDERDKRVIERSSRVQWLAVVFTLVAWTIILTEAYHATGAVPSVFLYVIFMSVLIVSTLAQSAGIIIGYWGMDRHG